MPLPTQKIIESKLPDAIKGLPTEKWKIELSKRIKEIMDASNGPDDGPWHCAIGTRFCLNMTNKGNGFAHFTIGQYIHGVVWQTSEKIAMINEDTDLSSFEDDHPIGKQSGGTPP